MTYEKQVKIWSGAVYKAAKHILSSKERTRKFLEKIGVNPKSPRRA